MSISITLFILNFYSPLSVIILIITLKTPFFFFVFFRSIPLLLLYFSSAIPSNPQLQVMLTPERKTATQAQKSAARRPSLSRGSTTVFLGGEVPDPSIIQLHPSHFWIKLSAILNVGTGVAYISWRATRSMPENPVRFVSSRFVFRFLRVLLFEFFCIRFIVLPFSFGSFRGFLGSLLPSPLRFPYPFRFRFTLSVLLLSLPLC